MQKERNDHGLVTAALSTVAVAQLQPHGLCCSVSPTCWHGERTVARLVLSRRSCQRGLSGAGSARSLGPTALQLGASLIWFARASFDFTDTIARSLGPTQEGRVRRNHSLIRKQSKE
jgi:hypothetical protein